MRLYRDSESLNYSRRLGLFSRGQHCWGLPQEVDDLCILHYDMTDTDTEQD